MLNLISQDVLLLSFVSVLVIYLVLKILNCGKEGLVNRPNSSERAAMVSVILKNPQLFDMSINLDDARNVMPWMDAVTFNDIKQLSRTGKFNTNNINSILQ